MNIVRLLRHVWRASAAVTFGAVSTLTLSGCNQQDEKIAIADWLETTRRNTPIVFTHLPVPVIRSMRPRSVPR